MNLVSRACPLCGSKNQTKVLLESNFDPSKLNDFSFASRKIPEFMHLRMVVCPDCNLCYASPIPELSWFTNEYPDADFDAATESGFAAKSYIRCLQKSLGPLSEFDDALDIGTGDGAFLGELLKHGLTRVHGVEPSAAPIRCAADNVAPLIRHGFFEPDAYASESFSLISCFQTVEHLTDPCALFQGVFRMLRPGGCFFIVAHNYRSLSARVLKGRSPVFDIEHLQLLSPRSASAMYKNTGFTNIRISYLVNKYPLSYWLRLAPLSEQVKNAGYGVLKKCGIQSFALGMPVGNIAAIGFKPETAC